MDQRVIEEKLESLRRSIKRIEEKRPNKLSDFLNDVDLQDIISVNLERAVQQCVDIGTHIIASSDEKAPSTMAETFETLLNLDKISKPVALSMKKAVGFRNVAVHNYQKIDWEIVFHISHKNLKDFKAFSSQINDLLNNPRL